MLKTWLSTMAVFNNWSLWTALSVFSHKCEAVVSHGILTILPWWAAEFPSLAKFSVENWARPTHNTATVWGYSHVHPDIWHFSCQLWTGINSQEYLFMCMLCIYLYCNQVKQLVSLCFTAAAGGISAHHKDRCCEGTDWFLDGKPRGYSFEKARRGQVGPSIPRWSWWHQHFRYLLWWYSLCRSFHPPSLLLTNGWYTHEDYHTFFLCFICHRLLIT